MPRYACKYGARSLDYRVKSLINRDIYPIWDPEYPVLLFARREDENKYVTVEVYEYWIARLKGKKLVAGNPNPVPENVRPRLFRFSKPHYFTLYSVQPYSFSSY
ncbi:hypothetical protein ABW19_dt0208800 [Dactylella cylindrospora]|nr:hypothetical protein ABW19_dt0208800 [Dactylella cylindrospora]